METANPAAAAPPIETDITPAAQAMLGNLIQTATGLADKASKASDRWWLAILMLFGMVALWVVLQWHREDQKTSREDQKAMSLVYSEVLRTNSDALTRVALALERVERKLDGER